MRLSEKSVEWLPEYELAPRAAACVACVPSLAIELPTSSSV